MGYLGPRLLPKVEDARFWRQFKASMKHNGFNNLFSRIKENFSGQLRIKSGDFVKCSFMFYPNSEINIVEFNLKAPYKDPENFVLLDREFINFTTT